MASHSTFQPSLLPLFPSTDNKSFPSQILDYGQRTQKLLPNIQLSKFTVETIIMCPHLHVCDSCSPDQCRSTIDKRPLVVMKQGCIVKISYTDNTVVLPPRKHPSAPITSLCGDELGDGSDPAYVWILDTSSDEVSVVPLRYCPDSR